LDALVVSVEGNVKATATGELLGALTVPILLQYRGGRFSVNAVGIVNVRPHFTFSLTAGVRVFTDLYVGSITYYEKDPPWQLASASWDPDFHIGMLFPVNYVFGEPLGLNTDQVAFILPNFGVQDLLKSGIKNDGKADA
jgi:hypothetical protein